ncbi:hypothetical protein BFW38_06385 [Terasakiispira papahanaumokuakeensis]|uniref:Uncharacterized protein n=1 Tax=Terasakiispira papahanaumokuakeensis TaxID=197479 RepID=A0A1E2V988_9GAMM|nr:hypothetical protein [Terasakiispira papahanaumokuakeensis]ODC03225.1 hypothetical protein BFW38_06385 [Terasakiispira papahanaumokuakeensis]
MQLGLKATVFAVPVALLMLAAAYYYLGQEREAAWERGYQAAQAESAAQLAAMQHRQSQQQLQLQMAAAARSASAERQYLAQTRQLNHQIEQLQEQLNDALIDQPDCRFGARWVQHYSAALGLPVVDTADRAGSHDADTAAAASAATLLQHAQRYGHWCRSAVQQLTALQRLIRAHQIRAHREAP